MYKRYKKLPSCINLRVWPKGFCHPLRPLCTVLLYGLQDFLDELILVSIRYKYSHINYSKLMYSHVYKVLIFISKSIAITPT